MKVKSIFEYSHKVPQYQYVIHIYLTDGDKHLNLISNSYNQLPANIYNALALPSAVFL